jgi:chromosome partitioning protein
MRIIAVANQKGGVGKTTTALNLAAALAEADRRVLLLDLDPQANATSGLGIENAEPSIYDVLVDGQPLQQIVRPTNVPGLDLAPSHIDLSAAELELVAALAREYVLKRAIDRAALDYDVMIIDCPPSLGLLTLNALVAAGEVLIPVQCEYYALAGLAKLIDTVGRVRTALNPQLAIAGVALTMYDGRTNLARDVVAEVRGSFSGRVFDTLIPRSVRLAEAPSHGEPITVYDPHGSAAQAYRDLAGELIGSAGASPVNFEATERSHSGERARAIVHEGNNTQGRSLTGEGAGPTIVGTNGGKRE